MTRPNNGQIDPVALAGWIFCAFFTAAVWIFVGWLIIHGFRSVQ
jgi:hypothetical protein